MTLFIIKSSGWSRDWSALDYASEGDTLLLMQDAVLALASQDSPILKLARERRINVLALEDDVVARGLKNSASVKLVKYGDFVDLIEKNKVFS